MADGRYYAHPTNQFWRLIGDVLGDDLTKLPYEFRVARLIVHKIGLWDVIASADRRGSLDSAIREAQHNRIEKLVHDFPSLRAIGFNGSIARSVGRKLVGKPPRKIALIDLPSSSAANTKPYSEKVECWSALKGFVES